MVVLSKWESGVAFETLPLDTLHEADLSGRFMPGVDFQDADLTGASLRKANCDHARFRYADLRRADLREAILIEADFSFADLRHADLRGAMLEDANLRAARLEGANLRGVTYNALTSWPADFEPEISGAVSVRGFDPDEHFPETAAQAAPPIRIRNYGSPGPVGCPPPEMERRLLLLAAAATAALVAAGLCLR